VTATPDLDTYSLTSVAPTIVPAPDLDYRPPMPRDGSARIALVGAGGISASHLDAYRAAGFNVTVVCSRTLAHAVSRRDAWFPEAEATDDVAGTLARRDIDVIDLTPHPAVRLPLIEAALRAGKHVLSQKPFVLDLDDGAAWSTSRRRATSSSPSTRMAASHRTSRGCGRQSAPA
jgi:hypothetical protein